MLTQEKRSNVFAKQNKHLLFVGSKNFGLGSLTSRKRVGDFEIAANLARQVFVDFAMARNCRNGAGRALHIDGVISALS